jgi:hypothetical protein
MLIFEYPLFFRSKLGYQQEHLFLMLKNIVPKNAAKGSLISELRETKFKEGLCSVDDD